MSFANTIDGPWIPTDQIPKELSHHFSLQSDPLREIQMQNMQIQQKSQGNSKLPAHDYNPPPLDAVSKQTEEEIMMRHWLKQQWLSAMAGAYSRGAQEDHVLNYHHSQQQKENQTMTQQSRNPNAPLQQFKDGSVSVKIWEQNKGDSHFVTASVGKLYKQDGGWKESRSFSQTDLQKLQDMLPQINQEMQKWQDYYRGMEKQQAPEQSQIAPQQAPMQQQDMVAARDAAMQGAQQAEQHTNTQEHAPDHVHEHSIEHSR